MATESHGHFARTAGFLLLALAILACAIGSAHAAQECTQTKAFRECRKLNLATASMPSAPYAEPSAVFQNLTTHNAWVARSREQRDAQKAWFNSFGIGPWKTDGVINGSANYCGCTVHFVTEVSLTESRSYGINPYWFEIFFPLSESGPNFFSDWIEKSRGQSGDMSIPYSGLAVKIDEHGHPLISHDEFLAFIEAHDGRIIFHFGWDAPGGKNAYFVIIGSTVHEIVYVNPTTGPIMDPVSPAYTNPLVGGIPVYRPRGTCA
jgi:hypothetical protein